MRPLETVLADRISARTVDDGGCRVWIGARNDQGYGQIWHPGVRKVIYTHRLAYEFANGPVPDGLQIDHLCRNRACCRLSHLEAVTPKENQRRGIAVLRMRLWAASITECPHGHAYGPENTYVCKRGKRMCRACGRERMRARRAAARHGRAA